MEENKMGVMPIGKLIVTMSLPIMISMLVQALYNIVDSVFVARIDEYALTAVSMAFPIQNLMIAVSVGTAVGVNALLARYLGAKDYEKVNFSESLKTKRGCRKTLDDFLGTEYTENADFLYFFP